MPIPTTKIIMFGHFLYVKVNAPLFLRKFLLLLVVARAPEVDKYSYQALYQAHYTRPSGPAYLQPIVKCPLKCSYQ